MTGAGTGEGEEEREEEMPVVKKKSPKKSPRKSSSPAVNASAHGLTENTGETFHLPFLCTLKLHSHALM